MCQKNKVLHKIRSNQEIFTKLLKTMHQLSINLLCQVPITEQLTVFVKLSMLSNRQRVYQFIFRGYFWKISHESSLVFLSREFARLYFLQIWFIISGRGDMSNFMGVGIFWIGLNRADLGCWRLTLSRGIKFLSRLFKIDHHSLNCYFLTWDIFACNILWY